MQTTEADAAQPDIPGPDLNVKAPTRKAPAGSCDCHMHIFGPPGTVPLSPDRSYTPAEANMAAYRHMADTLGITRTVVVQPSVYGTDNGCTREAVESLGANGRGVAVVDDETPTEELRRLDDAGFCGARFNLVTGGGVALDKLETVAGRLADLGWHLQTFISARALNEVSDRIAGLPVDVVVDHLGGPDPRQGIGQPGFQALLRLLDNGRTWVKTSGAYRVDSGPAPWPLADPFAAALIAAAPDRMVWGTDWPHPHLAGPMPNDGDLLDRLHGWIGGDVALWQKILVDNPGRLYGFA
jgi:predicted TIM-barrel fold metal-dependent hydrolase